MADPVNLSQVTGRGMIELRLRPLDGANRKAVAAALGAELPVKPRTSSAARGRLAFWLSPDQWLVTCPAAETAALVAALARALADREAAIVDVSDARRIIAITGSAARLVLMKGTSTDLMDEEVRPGFVRRARFADLATLIHCAGADSFELYVLRSYHDYVQRWLVQTARETSLFTLYGAQAVPAV